MGGKANLIVNVEEYNACAADIYAVCCGLDRAMCTLVQYLQNTRSSGLEAGESADSFSTFTSEIAKLNGKLKETGTTIQSVIISFLTAIDDADDLLFENTDYKPFTDDEFNACLAVVDNTTVPSLDFGLKGILAKIFDKLCKLVQIAKQKSQIDANSVVLAENVDNLKRNTRAKLAVIQNGVKAADQTHQKQLCIQLDVLRKYRQALQQIDSIISNGNGVFTDVGLTALASCVCILDEPISMGGYSAGGEGYSNTEGGAGARGGIALRGITETTDTEYAELCYLSYGALNGEEDPCQTFADMIRNSDYISSNSSLKRISASQIHCIDQPSGLQCFILTEEDKAVVIFVGTNGDIGDYVADATLTVMGTPVQTLEARNIIDTLDNHYGEIVVTGHSLGGHLATDVTLTNSKVSKCVTFDPPGRYDAPLQNIFNKDNTSKLTTYEAIGSGISSVGYETGKVVRLDVQKTGSFITQNHSIEEIRNAIHAKEPATTDVFSNTGGSR